MIFSKQLVPFSVEVLVAGLSTVSTSYFPQFNQDADGDAGIIAGGVEQVHVTTAGYVGIGTLDPLAKFVVDGTGLSNGIPVASFEQTDSTLSRFQVQEEMEKSTGIRRSMSW